MKKPLNPITLMENVSQMKTLSGELRAGLADYWQIADDILRQGGVELKPPGEADFSFKRNFFSLLFLYSFHRARLPKPRRILYAAALQCLRGMVTGCDNLLDDEYKKTLDTDIPETALRFRSVIDIMVSDRVLFQLLLEACRRQEITMDQVAAATSASMRTMTRSGVQEASEEAGITTIIAPDELLQTVHHHKTGMLFTCPWDIPLAIEEMDESSVTPLLQGLYRTGMGCQVMDDMVDFTSDLERKRHNFLVSLIHHSQNQVEKKRLQELLAARGRQLLTVDLTTDFPASLSEAAATASRFLASGLSLLFSADHQSLVTPASQFLKERIGADRFMGMAR